MTGRRKLIGESLILIGVRAAAVVAQFGVMVLLARHLSLEHMGLYALFYATVGIARAAGPLGIDQASTRLLAIAVGSDNADARVREICVTGAILTSGVALAAALAAWGVFALGFGPSGYRSGEALFFSLALPAFVGIGLMLGQLRGLGCNLWAQAPDALGLQLLVLGQVLAFIAIGNFTLFSAMMSLTIAGWAVLTFQIWFRLRLGRFGGPLPSGAVLREVLVDGWCIFQAHIVTVGTVYLPTFLTAVLAGPTAVAVLEIAQRFGNLPSLLTSSIGATYNPTYARLAAAGESKHLGRVMCDAGLLAGVPALAYMLLIAFGGRDLVLAFFPPTYLPAVVPIVIIAAGSGANALFAPFSNVYLMSGRAVFVRHFSLAALVVVAIGSWGLGPIWGATGIALAILAGRLVRDSGLAAHHLIRTQRRN